MKNVGDHNGQAGKLEPVETDRRDATMVRRPLAPAGYISSEEAALRSGYTNRYLMHLARTGRLPARVVRRRWFIDERTLDAFVINRAARTKAGRPRKSMRPG